VNRSPGIVTHATCDLDHITTQVRHKSTSPPLLIQWLQRLIRHYHLVGPHGPILPRPERLPKQHGGLHISGAHKRPPKEFVEMRIQVRHVTMMQVQSTPCCFFSTFQKCLAFRGRASHPWRFAWVPLGDLKPTFPGFGWLSGVYRSRKVRLGPMFLVGVLSIADSYEPLALDEHRR
jgi:hypothetical protein